MSRETLLDDAITKAKEAEDWQLVEWLRQARGSESAARWYTEKLRDAHRTIRKLLNENAKLRTFLGDGSIVTDYWKDEDGTMHVLTTDGEHTYEYMRGGLADENAKLRELCGELAGELHALGVDFNRIGWCFLRDELHELGIEVDE